MTKKVTLNDAEKLAGIALAEALKDEIRRLDLQKQACLRRIEKLEELGIIPPDEAEEARKQIQ